MVSGSCSEGLLAQETLELRARSCLRQTDEEHAHVVPGREPACASTSLEKQNKGEFENARESQTLRAKTNAALRSRWWTALEQSGAVHCFSLMQFPVTTLCSCCMCRFSLSAAVRKGAQRGTFSRAARWWGCQQYDVLQVSSTFLKGLTNTSYCSQTRASGERCPGFDQLDRWHKIVNWLQERNTVRKS